MLDAVAAESLEPKASMRSQARGRSRSQRGGRSPNPESHLKWDDFWMGKIIGCFFLSFSFFGCCDSWPFSFSSIKPTDVNAPMHKPKINPKRPADGPKTLAQS